MIAGKSGRGWVAAACAALIAVFLCTGTVWAKGPRASGPMLWIVADRIVGFVPFTVYLYGKVSGGEPGRMELCRQEVEWLTDAGPSAGGRPGAGPSAAPRPAGGSEAPCASGILVRTPDGYDYQHDLRFEKPGTYQVRLSMVDPQGHRVLSNAVQVRAF